MKVLNWDFTKRKKGRNKYLLFVAKEWQKWDLEEKILIPILIIGTAAFFVVLFIEQGKI